MTGRARSLPRDVPVVALQEWLAAGRPVTVLDVRSSTARSEWFIPGSVHVDAWEALSAGKPGPVSDIPLPPDLPVVAVCTDGQRSRTAREALATRGFSAHSLLGGMKAWSLAWNRADVPLPDKGGVSVIQLRRTGKGCLSYLVGAGGEAVVIDPSLDPRVYLELATTAGWRIIAALDTHVHADHISRARPIAALTGGAVRLPETARVSFPYQPVRDGEGIRVGGVELTAMRTPGHTPESMSYRLDNRALFTGDTLLAAGVGRTDLDATPAGAQRRAKGLFRSLEHILSLPGHLAVLPAHAGEPVPFDGRPVATSLGALKERLAPIATGEKVFVAAVLANLPPPPPNHQAILRLNEKGLFPEGDPTDLEAGACRCAAGAG